MFEKSPRLSVTEIVLTYGSQMTQIDRINLHRNINVRRLLAENQRDTHPLLATVGFDIQTL